MEPHASLGSLFVGRAAGAHACSPAAALVLASSLVSGCFAVATGEAVGEAARGERREIPAQEKLQDAPGSQATKATTAAFALHEWGVVSRPLHLSRSDSVPAVESSLATSFPWHAHAEVSREVQRRKKVPKIEMIEQTVDKPLIWIHPDEGQAPFELRVTVQAGQGDGVASSDQMTPPSKGARLVETWPDCDAETSIPGQRCDFAIKVTPGSCPYGALPGPSDPHCTQLDDRFCEAESLALVETSDAACLRATVQVNALLYRLRSSVAPELSVEPSSDGLGSLTLQRQANRVPSDTQLQDTTVLRVSRGARRHETTAVEVRLAPSSTQVTLPVPTKVQPELVLAWVDRGLRERGMTSDEIAAFHRAWDVDLVGALSTESEVPVADETDKLQDKSPTDGKRPLDDVLVKPSAPEQLVLAWMSGSELVANATIASQPAPHTTNRAALIIWRETMRNETTRARPDSNP